MRMSDRWTAVNTEDLARVVRQATEGPGARWTLVQLAEASGVGERKLTGIKDCTYRSTSLRVADTVLCALDQGAMLFTGEVRVVPDGRGRRCAEAAS